MQKAPPGRDPARGEGEKPYGAAQERNSIREEESFFKENPE